MSTNGITTNYIDLSSYLSDPIWLPQQNQQEEEFELFDEPGEPFRWTVVNGENLNETISGRLFCPLERVEVDRSAQKYRLYKRKYHYSLFLPKTTFIPTTRVSFGIKSDETREFVGDIIPDTTSSKTWVIFQIGLRQIQFNSGKFNQITAQFTLTQNDRELHSQDVLIFQCNRKLHDPVTLDPAITITLGNSESFPFQSLNNTNANEQVSARIFCSKKIEPNLTFNCLQFYERCRTYSLLLPKNVFNTEKEVQVELIRGDERYPFLSLLPDPLSNDSWTIYTFTFLDAPRMHANRPYLTSSLILTQEEKSLVSAPFSLHSADPQKSRKKQPAPVLEESLLTLDPLVEKLAAEYFYELEAAEANSMPIDDKSCGLAWKIADQGIYTRLSCDCHALKQDPYTKLPILGKTRNYTIQIPPENNPFDLSKPVHLEVQFQNSKFSILATKGENKDQWDEYPIILSDFPYTSGPSKHTARLILSQDEKELISNEVFIFNRIRSKTPAKKPRLI